MTMSVPLALLACIGAATVGGVFFAFSTFVMRALAQLPAGQGVAAMQRINVVVLNPLFLGLFLGTAFLCTACAVAAFLPWSAQRSPLLVASGGLYLAGSLGVTMARNVPRNKKLARAAPEAAGTADYWRQYVREWTRWNHVRTVASIGSAACSAASLAT